MDWGLGHATRCIPIIRELLHQGAKVSLASSGRAGKLLQSEFPDLSYLQLPSYKIRYYTSNMYWNMAWQGPKFLRAIFAERLHLKKLIRQHHFDAIISDNRFGCFHPHVPSIFMTHQLHIKIPDPVFNKVVNWINQKIIRQFDQCWVPDYPGPENLAGSLSFPPIHAKTIYLGPLSRMQPLTLEKRYDLIVILSGPEPQRSNLEKALLIQLQKLPYKVLVVQGKTEVRARKQRHKNIEIVAHLTTPDLNRALASSRYVICRSGYSSIMDLAATAHKALLIPTPGQTEQEYLADQLLKKGLFLKQTQEKLDLNEFLNEMEQFSGLSGFQDRESRLPELVQTFLQSL